MALEWNRVTWYSKLVAVLLFVATFAGAFYLGIAWEEAHIAGALTTMPGATQTPPVLGGEAGARCGGFIRNAPTCTSGFHCQLDVNAPDTGGTCVADEAATTASSTVPSWATGMQILTGDDNGATFHLTQNERFAVRLGSTLAWVLTFAPAGNVTRVANSLTTDGFQGIYEADALGTTTLTATGHPVCAPSEACPQFIVEYSATLVVSH